MEHRGVLLLHAHGTAPAPDIPGDGVDLRNVKQLDGLLPHRFGGLLQIQIFRHRHFKYIDALGGSPGHQRLEPPGRVLSQRLGHMDAILPGALRALALLVKMGGVRDLFLVQNPHHIRLLFLVLCHKLTSKYTRPPGHTGCPGGSAVPWVLRRSAPPPERPPPAPDWP